MSVGELWFGTLAIVNVAEAAIDAAHRRWGWVAWDVAWAIINAILWHQSRRRRKRKRAAALAGAKSRARIAKLVRRARESMQPRPVPQPVPGGTR